jgi:hypothetical protein
MFRIIFVILMFIVSVSNIQAQSDNGIKTTVAQRDNRYKEGVSAIVTVKYKPKSNGNSVFFMLDASTKIVIEDGYNYQQIQYRSTQIPVLRSLLSNAKAAFPTVAFKVYYKNVFRGYQDFAIVQNSTMGLLGEGFNFNCSKDEAQDINNWTLEAFSLKTFNYSPDPLLGLSLKQAVLDYLNSDNEKNQYKELITRADRLYFKNEYQQSFQIYSLASRNKYTDEYPRKQMLKLKELIDKQSTDEKIKSLINSAKNLEQNGDFVTALKFYSESLKLNPGNYDVKKSISVLNEKIKNKDNNLEKLLSKNNEEYSSEIKSEKNAAINSLNFQSEGVSELLELNETNEKKLLNELDESQRESVLKNDKKNNEVQDSKSINKSFSEIENKKSEDERLQQFSKELSYAEKDMAYNKYEFEKLRDEAENYYSKFKEQKPENLLNIKQSWWDRNSYMEPFRDELNEPKRLEAFNNYINSLIDRQLYLSYAKSLFLKAISFVDNGSSEHRYLIFKAKLCDKLLSYQPYSLSVARENEKLRKEYRERNKISVQILKNNEFRNKSALAYSYFEIQNINNGKDREYGDLSQKKADLEQRFRDAEFNYTKDMAITGVSTEAVLSVITDDSKQAAIFENKSAGFNVRLMSGVLCIPVVMNQTSDNNIAGISYTDHVKVMPINGGLDIWMLRSNHFDIGLSPSFIMGVFPMKGVSNFYSSFDATMKFNLGVKNFKLAFETGYQSRSGSSKVDYDVTNSQLSDGSYNPFFIATGEVSEGKFKYSLIKAGAGFHINLKSKYSEQYIRLMAYAQRPSFLKDLKINHYIYAYNAEILFGNSIALTADYSSNYVIGGKPKYTLSENKSRTFWSVRLGKIFTLAKSK